MAKLLLNSMNIFLNEIDRPIGDALSEIPILDIYDSRQCTVYYENGLSEFDKKFDEYKFYQHGYVFTIISYPKCLALFFFQYRGNELRDMGVAYLNRSSIIRFEELPANNLLVVKKKEGANYAKYLFRNSAGLTGLLAGKGLDSLKSFPTDQTSGKIYNLFYRDSNNAEKVIKIYSSSEYMNSTSLFLNTYFKEILDPAALIPAKKSGGCFIATACYRDLYSEEVIFFRRYRDIRLSKTALGRGFINIYYKVSPPIYNYLLNHPKHANQIKKILDRIYVLLKSSNNID